MNRIDLCSNFLSTALNSSRVTLTKTERYKLESLRNSLETAVHFSIPHGGKILDDDLKGLDGLNSIRLPFPTITISFDTEYSDGTISPLLAVFMEIEDPRVDDPECPELVGACFFQEPSSNMWTLSPFQTNLRNNLNGVSMGVNEYGHAVVNADTSVELFFPTMLEAIQAEDESDVKCALEFFKNVVSLCGYPMLSLCEALVCSNVTFRPKNPVSQRIKEKRKRLGRSPIHEINELVISARGKVLRDYGSGNTTGRTVCQHLRRGHIRVIQSGRKVWVNSCVVGAGESLKKNIYRVTA